MSDTDPRPDASRPASPSPRPAEVYGPRPPYGAYYPYGGYPPPAAPWGAVPGPVPAAAAPARRRRVVMGSGAAVVAAALVLAGVGIGRYTDSPSAAATSTQVPATSSNDGTTGGASGYGASGSGSGSFGSYGGTSGGFGSGGAGSSSGTSGGFGAGNGTSGSSGTTSTTATSTQQSGVVTVVSVLKYENAESAGTGLILTSDGEILTNNHVVRGATSITVTVESTDKSYRAEVVGTDATDDVAVLQLRNASGLTTAKIGNSSDVAKGDSVTGVGNAGGTGTLTAVSGKVTGLGKSITATDDDGSNPEKLTGLIETDAAIAAGDSGGPLYDSSGQIIGIDTAASSSSAMSNEDAYAIPIDTALTIANKIESGVQTTTIRIGLPAFLGVAVVPTSDGAGVESVVTGGPAAKAGITAGSVITAVGGRSVTSATSLESRLSGLRPGQQVSVSWTDTAGRTHSGTVKLVGGPVA